MMNYVLEMMNFVFKMRAGRYGQDDARESSGIDERWSIPAFLHWLCIKSHGICIRNDELCIENHEFSAESHQELHFSTARHRRSSRNGAASQVSSLKIDGFFDWNMTNVPSPNDASCINQWWILHYQWWIMHLKWWILHLKWWILH